MHRLFRRSVTIALVFILLPIIAAGFTPDFAGPEFRVNTYTDGRQSGPKIAYDGSGRMIIVWTSIGQDGDGAGVYGQRYDSVFSPLGTEFQVNTTTVEGQSCQGVAANASGEFIVTWFSAETYSAFQRYSAAGNAVGGERIEDTGLVLYRGGVVLTDEGDFEILWDGGYWSGGLTLIQGRGYDDGGIACSNSVYYWASTGLQRDYGGNRAGDIVVIYGNNATPTTPTAARTTVCGSYSPGITISETVYVAVSPNGDFVVFWSTSWFDTADVLAQRYDSGLNPVGGQLTVATDIVDGLREVDAVMLANGNILFVWDELDGGPYSSRDVFARLYVPGHGFLDEFRVNENSAHFQKLPVVTASDDGAFLVAWEHTFGDPVNGWETEVYARGILPIPTGIEPDMRGVPGHVLAQNYPNPFAQETALQYHLAEPAEVSIRIYDVQGKLVKEIPHGYRAAGPHEAAWDGRDAQGNPVSSGTYFYELHAGEHVMSKKMVLLK